MATYKVISLTVGGLNNKIFKYGEQVTEKAFGEKRIQSLVDGGYIVEVVSEQTETLNSQTDAPDEQDLTEQAIAKVEAAAKAANKPKK